MIFLAYKNIFCGFEEDEIKKIGKRNNLLNLVSKSHFYFLSSECKTAKMKPTEILGLESPILPTQKQQCRFHNETK